jgi:class 3 adenylate cyclase
VSDAFVTGVFFGLIGAVAAYHLLMYAVLRTNAFLAYGAYLVALLALQSTRAPGTFADPNARQWFFWWSFAALTVLGYWLFRSFLDLPEQQPRLEPPFRWVAFAVALGALGAPLLPPLYARGLQLAALLLLCLAAWTLIAALRHGVRVARFFGVAYAGLFVGAVAQFVNPHSWGIELGSAFQAVTLALGLADRIAAANEERDRAQRRTIEEIGSLNVAYARFVPQEFLELLGKRDVRQVRLGEGIERDMTVLFTDVRSFTTLSETMTPGQTFGFINELLERTGPAVREHGGIVDKYVGDAIMALFPRSADDALRAALTVQDCVAEYNAERAARGDEPIRVGIGLHRGSVMAGTIGEHERMDGTVIADAVNVASRVEGLTKYFGAAVLLSDEVRSALAVPESYAMRYLGRVAVQGKRNGIGLYEALDGEPAERRAAKLAGATAFAGAVQAFVDGSFTDAVRRFEAILERDPDDGAARYLQGRSFALAASPGPWDGVDQATK